MSYNYPSTYNRYAVNDPVLYPGYKPFKVPGSHPVEQQQHSTPTTRSVSRDAAPANERGRTGNSVGRDNQDWIPAGSPMVPQKGPGVRQRRQSSAYGGKGRSDRHGSPTRTMPPNMSSRAPGPGDARNGTQVLGNRIAKDDADISRLPIETSQACKCTKTQKWCSWQHTART